MTIAGVAVQSAGSSTKGLLASEYLLSLEPPCVGGGVGACEFLGPSLQQEMLQSKRDSCRCGEIHLFPFANSLGVLSDTQSPISSENYRSKERETC